MKTCTKCSETKPLEQFYKNGGADRRRADCKACVLSARSNRYSSDPSYRSLVATTGREYQLHWKYGLTERDYARTARSIAAMSRSDSFVTIRTSFKPRSTISQGR